MRAALPPIQAPRPVGPPFEYALRPKHFFSSISKKSGRESCSSLHTKRIAPDPDRTARSRPLRTRCKFPYSGDETSAMAAARRLRRRRHCSYYVHLDVHYYVRIALRWGWPRLERGVSSRARGETTSGRGVEA